MKHCVDVPVENVKMLEELEIGDTIDVVVTGKVKMLRAPEKPERDGPMLGEAYYCCGRIELEDVKVKVIPENEFDVEEDED
jgi:hypothetical protein